mgnify:CR=1 FL=1
MKFDNIKHSAQRLNSLIDGWQTNGEIPRIERDLALDEIRRLYDQLLDIDTSIPEVADAPMSAPIVAPVVVDMAENTAEEVASEEIAAIEDVASVAEPAVVDVAEPVAVEEDEEEPLDIDALLGLSSVAVATTVAATAAPVEAVAEPNAPIAEEVAVEQPVAAEVVAAPVEESIAEPIVTPEESSATNGELFAMEDIPVSRGNGRKIISIYNTAGMAAATATAATTNSAADAIASPQAPVEEQPKRIADVLASDKKVLAEKIASAEKPTTPFHRITDLRKAIGINDKFLMIKDLFGGDVARYEATIDTLNEFEDLDDCMIYIVENFSWNPDSEGAKLLVSLIERKLS